MKNAATGAVLGVPDDFDFSGIDDAGNGDGIVCVKTVPGGKGKGAARTIAKDNANGVCPGGFDDYTLVTGPLPLCTYDGQPVSECDCAGAWGEEVDGLCSFAG